MVYFQAIKGHTKRDACPYITRKEPNTECVAEFITEDSCENGRGEWIKVQQTSKKSHTAEFTPSDRVGVAYEPRLITQGTREDEKYLVPADPPEVLFAPFTVVNYNVTNMDGSFLHTNGNFLTFPPTLFSDAC